MGGLGCDHQDRTGGVSMWMSRWSRLLFALVVCVAALGCSGAVDQGGGDSPTQQANGAATENGARQSNGTPGSPGERPEGQSGGAVGAPSNGVAILMPRNDSLRLEFTPAAARGTIQRPAC
jgi:hypothetical protein